MRNPLKLEPAALGAAAAAVYALAQYLWLVFHDHTTTPDAAVIVALAGAAWQTATRALVTPVAAPKTSNGVPLVPAAVTRKITP